MTRAEAYAEGWADGQVGAELDCAGGIRLDPEAADYTGDKSRAYDAGYRRGYRDTWARWDSGALTWEMLEHAPLGRSS